jgi:Methyltransferase domain
MRGAEWMKRRRNWGNQPSVAETHRTLIHFVDVYWCDAFGTYLQGWAILEDSPLERIAVRSGSREFATQRGPRADLLPHYPSAVGTELAGFSVYVPGRPGVELALVGVTGRGEEVSVVLELPDHPLPILPPVENDPPPNGIAMFGDAPAGPILAVGIRSPTEEVLTARLAEFGDREVVGFDVHPGLGVDVVGDAHRLSSYFPPNHFAGIYSTSLLEHLTTPWLFAAECSRVLMPGGRVLHQAPWAWPTHALPNDFWRFSNVGLQAMFSEELGFRTIRSGQFGSARIVPDPGGRELQMLMATTTSALSAWIELEKISENGRSASWPYDADAGAVSAREYPVDGLAPPPA